MPETNYAILHYAILHNPSNLYDMKQLSNPFVIGKYVDKDYFCDREKESELLVHHIVNGRNVTLKPNHGTVIWCPSVRENLKRKEKYERQVFDL